METDTDALFRQFIARVDRDTLAEKAEKSLTGKANHVGAVSVFADYPGGLIGFTIRQLLLDSTDFNSLSELDRLVDQLVEFFGFRADWVPPRLLVREALAHTVQRQRIIERLQREFGKSVKLASVFDRAATTIRNPQEAFLLDDEHTDAVLEELRQAR